eukprot:11158232-Lingulodinium_polyedra.AAC.1
MVVDMLPSLHKRLTDVRQRLKTRALLFAVRHGSTRPNPAGGFLHNTIPRFRCPCPTRSRPLQCPPQCSRQRR